MLGYFIVFLTIEYMFGEGEPDEFQATREELFEDIYDKNTIIQTILKESEKKDLSYEDIKDIINPHTILL